MVLRAEVVVVGWLFGKMVLILSDLNEGVLIKVKYKACLIKRNSMVVGHREEILPLSTGPDAMAPARGACPGMLRC